MTYFTYIILYGSIHVATDGKVSFFLMAESYSIVYMHHFFFIHSSIDGHLGFLHILASVNNAAINIGCVCLFNIVFWVSSEVELLGPSLSHYSLCSKICFVLNSILSCISIATQAFFFFFQVHKISFPFLYFRSVCVSIWRGSLVDSIWKGLLL